MPEAITTAYFKQYRQKLGFASQRDAKCFFAAKDVVPSVDMTYLSLLNNRLEKIVDKINEVMPKSMKQTDMRTFKEKYIAHPFQVLLNNGLLALLNNQGRRPEQVYFSWMRGFIVANYFLPSLGLIFEIDLSKITLIGDDDLSKIDSFRRTPTADLELLLATGDRLRLEIQSGFQGINDIKQHKVLEARRIFAAQGVRTVVVHFDLYNGQVAFVELMAINDDDVNWITRQQMEGQTVFNIEQNYFVWKLTDPIINYYKLVID